MPNSRLAPDLAQPATDVDANVGTNVGEWRDALRREHGAAARLRWIVDAANALQCSPEIARARLLATAMAMADARDGALLALRGERWQVMASHGRALPPGASLAGGWSGAPDEVVAARAGHGIDWWLGPSSGASAGMRPLEACVAVAGQSIGVLSLAVPAARRVEASDLEALQVLAAIACALVAEPATAQKRVRRAEATRLSSLTRRERQVLTLLTRGLTNAAVAEELAIAPGTAKIHVERILRKLGLTDRTQAAVYATRHGVGA
jgi:DNA-binding CsgD family transcriptional regulator